MKKSLIATVVLSVIASNAHANPQVIAATQFYDLSKKILSTAKHDVDNARLAARNAEVQYGTGLTPRP